MTETWRQLAVPGFCERLIGFSVPQDDTVLVVSYEGMHLVRLGSSVTVETDEDYREYDVYDPDTGICQYGNKEWQIIGLYDGHPILIGKDGEELVLDAQAEVVSVTKCDEVIWSAGFENFSGDWAAATFSPDARLIVLGCPYDFDFRIWERLPDAGEI